MTYKFSLGWLLPFQFAGILSATTVPNPSYSEDEARHFAYAASVSYCAILEPVYNWTCESCKRSGINLIPGKIKMIDSDTWWGEKQTRVLVGAIQGGDACFLSFRGSDNPANTLRDIEAWHSGPALFPHCDGCLVHAGFNEIWERTRPRVLQALAEVGCPPNGTSNVLDISGHSLGGSIVHLAMFDLYNLGYRMRKTYSFEAPRTGNVAFAEAFNRRFSQFPNVIRVTHNKDPIVHLPTRFMGYQHVQTEVFYQANGSYRVCNWTEDHSCSDRDDWLAHNFSDHCNTPLLPQGSKGNLCNPLGCLPEEHSRSFEDGGEKTELTASLQNSFKAEKRVGNDEQTQPILMV